MPVSIARLTLGSFENGLGHHLLVSLSVWASALHVSVDLGKRHGLCSLGAGSSCCASGVKAEDALVEDEPGVAVRGRPVVLAAQLTLEIADEVGDGVGAPLVESLRGYTAGIEEDVVHVVERDDIGQRAATGEAVDVEGLLVLGELISSISSEEKLCRGVLCRHDD